MNYDDTTCTAKMLKTDRTSVLVVRKWRVGKYWAENPVEFENISGILVVQST